MKIIKILNNNVVLTSSSAHDEIVVMGRGLAFQKKIGDEIDEGSIEKTFVLETPDLADRLTELLGDTSTTNLYLANEIVEYANKTLGTKLSDNIYITLTDHIGFARSRKDQGIQLKNALEWEIKKFYPKEYAIGLKSLEIIKEISGTELGEDEAGFIALHIVNARQDGQAMETTIAMTQIVQDILNIVKYHYGRALDESSINFARFMTHLQYFARRTLQNENVDSGDDFLFDQVQLKYPKAFACTDKINEYLKHSHHKELTNDERVYLTLHIARVNEKNETPPKKD